MIGVFSEAGRLAYLVEGNAATPEGMRVAAIPEHIPPAHYRYLSLIAGEVALTPPPESGLEVRDGGLIETHAARLLRLFNAGMDRINQAAENAITAGFTSAALGAPHQYSSQLDDQLNLTGAVLRGEDMPYACRDEQGTKAFRLHTAAQLRQVGDDFTLYKLQLLQRANELKQQLDLALAAGDAEAMQAITWEGAES